MSQSGNNSTTERLLFLDALRAMASVLIVWHHFALYPPLSEQAEPILGTLVRWFSDYARSTQFFFVISGFVLARSMSGMNWDVHAFGHFITKRYFRLGIPYLAAIVLALAANGFGRGWLPDEVVGSPPTLAQLLAHVFFVQELMGYEHLSAGLWFVCINFQLGLIYAFMFWLRDTLAGLLRIPTASPWIDVPIWAGWILSISSLFYFNCDSGWDSWGIYFMPYFFMGVVIHRALKCRASEPMFWVYQLMIIAAMCYDWRWRLTTVLAVGLLLFVAAKSGLAARWPRSRWIAQMGKVSYRLFLVHFPVLLVVSTLWTRFGWTSAPAAVAGLLVAFAASVAKAFMFYRWVETPTIVLTRKC